MDALLGEGPHSLIQLQLHLACTRGNGREHVMMKGQREGPQAGGGQKAQGCTRSLLNYRARQWLSEKESTSGLAALTAQRHADHGGALRVQLQPV